MLLNRQRHDDGGGSEGGGGDGVDDSKTIHPLTFLFSIVSHFLLAYLGTCEWWMVNCRCVNIRAFSDAIIFDFDIVKHFSARLNGLRFVEHYTPNIYASLCTYDRHRHTETKAPGKIIINKPVTFFFFFHSRHSVRIKSKWNEKIINWKFNQNEALA